LPAPSEQRSVAVSTMPSFGARWLVPRLGKFMSLHTDVELRISASEKLVDFAADGIDLGIRYGAGRYPGLSTEKLADDLWIVVCAPALLAERPLAALEDLERHVLLQDDAPDAWPRWLAANGVQHRLKARRTELTDSSMLIEAALRGQGVGLARWSLAADELAQGRLCLPFPSAQPLPTGLAYYVVAPPENLRAPAVAAFQRWVLSESKPLRVFGDSAARQIQSERTPAAARRRSHATRTKPRSG
jgi:LysR family transcriptional regulator, glycine cleavage system transcriptional activator